MKKFVVLNLIVAMYFVQPLFAQATFSAKTDFTTGSDRLLKLQ